MGKETDEGCQASLLVWEACLGRENKHRPVRATSLLDLKSVSLGQGHLGDQCRGEAEDGPWDAAPAGAGCSGCGIRPVRSPAPPSSAHGRTQCKPKADARSEGDVGTTSLRAVGALCAGSCSHRPEVICPEASEDRFPLRGARLDGGGVRRRPHLLTGLACEAPALHLPVLGSKACGRVCAVNLGLEGGGHCAGSQHPWPVPEAGGRPLPRPP